MWHSKTHLCLSQQMCRDWDYQGLLPPKPTFEMFLYLLNFSLVTRYINLLDVVMGIKLSVRHLKKKNASQCRFQITPKISMLLKPYPWSSSSSSRGFRAEL